ncbi:MFS transporter [Kribbella sp. NPDC051770]|uniref:MFS transporter n=1 Tax=Kribbella sp. NPDC051770 TaxID=3155413 RepID=UPI003415C566
MTTYAASRPSLMSRALVLRFGSILGSGIGFYLPLAVVPAYAGSVASGGLATGVLLFATVLAEMVTPRLTVALGYRWTLAVGLFLLGAPAFVLAAYDGTAVILAVSAVRGIGFAISVVAGGALTAALIPAERRGEGLAMVGLVAGVPGLVAMPLGVLAAERWGYAAVFVATALAPLVALVTIPGLPKREAEGAKDHGLVVGLRNPALTRPATLFALCATAAGVLVTFLPLVLTGPLTWVVAVALFVQPAMSTAARWFAGQYGDRRGQGGLLVPGAVLCVVGVAALAAVHTPAAVIAGAAVFGAGFGVLQNATLALMYHRVPAAGYSAVSAIWNAAFDLGMAVGATLTGVLLAGLGPELTIACTVLVMLPALRLASRDRG